jgi:hypothetical protein
MKKLLRNHSGTAEIVGTVLFLVILFFFFSNVFLWHNQVSRDMDQVIADKTNSEVRIETATLLGNVTNGILQSEFGEPGSQSLSESQTQTGFSLTIIYTFNTTIDTAEKKSLIADLRLSLYASYVDALNEPCLVYILDCNQNAWTNTGLTVTSGFRWSNVTLSFPSSYLDSMGNVTIKIADTSSQLGYNDTEQGTLNIGSVEVCADPIALEVTDLGGTDAALSRLWILNATDHTFYDISGNVIAGGSQQYIIASSESTLIAGNGNYVVVDFAPSSGQAVTFRVMTTLGNTAACTYDFS